MDIDTPDNISSTEPVEKIVEGLSPAKRAVYKAFVAHGPMTDNELVEKSKIDKSTSSPRRGELVKLGLIEAVGKVDTPSGKKATLWAPVPPERVAEARMRASGTGPRLRPATSFPLEMRLELVRQLLDMDDLNDAMRDQHGRAWSRSRGRANDRRGERNREVRENDAMIREAEERGSPIAEYFKLRRALLKSNERVLAVRRLVSEEIDRKYSDEPTIPRSAWPAVVDLLTDLARTCEETNAEIRAAMGVLGDDIVEGSAIEIEVLMLPEGDAGEADVF